MNHIKSINEYNRKDFYQSISTNEYLAAIHVDRVKAEITHHEFSELKKVIENVYSNSRNYEDYKLSYPIGQLNGRIRLVKYQARTIDIYKIEDEWFFVKVDDYLFYKCDQLDGVLELVKDIKRSN